MKAPKVKFKNAFLIPVILITLLFFGGLIGLGVWYHSSLQPAAVNSEARLFVVDEGSSAKLIAENLKALSLIRSSRAFLFYLDSKGYKNKLQAGTYRFSASMPSQTIAKKL